VSIRLVDSESGLSEYKVRPDSESTSLILSKT
jgi:hypothetical protein